MKDLQKSSGHKPTLDIESQVLRPNKKSCSIKRIINFVVTSDSVVAKALIITDQATRRIELDWGDGNIDIINRRIGSALVVQPALGEQPLPAGTYEVYHQYEVFYTNGFGDTIMPAPREYLVSLRVDDRDGGIDGDSQRIIINPRYRFNLYPVTIWLGSTCDPWYEDFNEFHIIQFIDGAVGMDWDWTASNNFLGKAQNKPLLGSQFSIEYENPPLGVFNFVQIRFDITEKDWLYDDHISFRISIFLYHTGDEEYFTQKIDSTTIGDGCTIHYSYATEVKLLIPLPVDTSRVFTAS